MTGSSDFLLLLTLLSLCWPREGFSFAPRMRVDRRQDRIILDVVPTHPLHASTMVEDQPRITRQMIGVDVESDFTTKLATKTISVPKAPQKQQQRHKHRTVNVSAEVDMPFSREVAYDWFADLPRQPEWSSWLHSVEWVADNNDDNPSAAVNTTLGPTRASKWTLKVAGFRYSWISVASHQDRPSTMAWESTSGLKNYGQVNFLPNGDDGSSCRMTMTMSFVPPRLVAGVFGNSRALKRYMEQTMVGSSLERFRDVVIDSTLGNATMLLTPM